MYDFGLVTQDDNGYLITEYTRCLQGTIELELAETKGVQEALNWIKEHRWQKLVLQTDCLGVMQMLRSSISMISLFDHTIQKCKMLLTELRNNSVSL